MKRGHTNNITICGRRHIMCDNWLNTSKYEAVFTETDMLQNEHNKVKTVNQHSTRLSGKIISFTLVVFK